MASVEGKSEAAPPSKSSCLPKALLGCGCLALLGGLLFVVAIVALGYWGFSRINEFTEDYVQQGYEFETGQLVEETTSVSGDKVYAAQVVNIHDGADGNLAFMAQQVEIDGDVSGNIDFLGQSLLIKPDARVGGNINVTSAQVVTVRGIVEGDITIDMGQTLEIGEDSVVHGSVHAEAVQAIIVKGRVLGEVEGNYQTLRRTDDSKPGRIELPEEENSAEVTKESIDL